jgi:DNA polymerase III sliding clamp (beta) subunit (PCNA family)
MKSLFFIPEIELLLGRKRHGSAEIRTPFKQDREAKRETLLARKTRPITRRDHELPAFTRRGKDGELRLCAESLKRIVDMVQLVTPRRPIVSATRVIKIESGKRVVVVLATDLEQQLTVELVEPLNDNGGGVFVLEPTLLQRLLRTRSCAFRLGLNGKEVEVECAGDGDVNRIEVVDNGDPAEFPEITRPHCSFRQVPGLGLALYEASRFVSREQVRYALTGIRLQGIDLVSSDGKRRYCRTLPDLKVDPSVTIPRLRILESKRHMLEDPLEIGQDAERVWIRSSWWTSSSSPLEGAFPEYRNVIPRSFKNRWNLSARDIGSLLKILPTLPYEKDGPAVQFIFEKGPQGHQVRVASTKDASPNTSRIRKQWAE